MDLTVSQMLISDLGTKLSKNNELQEVLNSFAKELEVAPLWISHHNRTSKSLKESRNQVNQRKLAKKSSHKRARKFKE